MACPLSCGEAVEMAAYLLRNEGPVLCPTHCDHCRSLFTHPLTARFVERAVRGLPQRTVRRSVECSLARLFASIRRSVHLRMHECARLGPRLSSGTTIVVKGTPVFVPEGTALACTGLFVGSSSAMNCVGAVKLARSLGGGARQCSAVLGSARQCSAVLGGGARQCSAVLGSVALP